LPHGNRGQGQAVTPPGSTREASGTSGLEQDLDALMRASRVIAGVVAESIAQAGDEVTAPQLRTLVLVATRSGVNASAVASALGIHPSNATRMLDRLVQAGLLDRRDSPSDRRRIALRLTGAGSRLVSSVMDYRRRAYLRILREMSSDDRRRLTTALEPFAVAAGEPPDPRGL
jgi:DNA-binding MarR family transcriptional regulator